MEFVNRQILSTMKSNTSNFDSKSHTNKYHKKKTWREND